MPFSLHIAAFVHGAFSAAAAAAASFLHLSWLENITLTQSMYCKIDSSRNTRIMQIDFRNPGECPLFRKENALYSHAESVGVA